MSAKMQRTNTLYEIIKTQFLLLDGSVVIADTPVLTIVQVKSKTIPLSYTYKGTILKLLWRIC